jgi:hypothetical protein
MRSSASFACGCRTHLGAGVLTRAPACHLRGIRACLFLLGACACLFLLGACASTAIVTRADELERIVAAATQRGARECAPQELALAKVNLEFARLELSQGDRHRADHHLTLAEPNAKAALRVASDGKCRGAAGRPAVEARSRAREPVLAVGPDEGAP